MSEKTKFKINDLVENLNAEIITLQSREQALRCHHKIIVKERGAIFKLLNEKQFPNVAGGSCLDSVIKNLIEDYERIQENLKCALLQRMADWEKISHLEKENEMLEFKLESRSDS